MNSTVNTSQPVDKYGYGKFDVPWSLRVACKFYYTKVAFKPVLSQTLSMTGDLSITKKTSINYPTGYDIARKEITMTSISISRDLHCWEMSLNWMPIGVYRGYRFEIKIKAPQLQDVKVTKETNYRSVY